ncbi:MAG TPA: phosphotransferase [Fastidiosipila sp.]|nr:phosphotransferase [Fastidiosipila sp.]
MYIEKEMILSSVDNPGIRFVHDNYGRTYQAKELNSFVDFSLIPYLYRLRSPGILRCVGVNNCDNLSAESVCHLKTGLVLKEVRQIDIKEDPGEVVVLFEYLEGVTLRQFSLRTVSAINEEISALYEQLFDQIRDTLEDFAALSKVGLRHGDISPDNIMITAGKQAVLIDFDKARVFLPGFASLDLPELPRKNIYISGTPGYSGKLAIQEQCEPGAYAQRNTDSVHPADQESLARSFIAALIKKPGSTLTATDIKSVLSRVQPGFAYKLLSALCASV